MNTTIKALSVLMLATLLAVPSFAAKDVASGTAAACRATVVFVEHPALLKKAAKGVKELSKGALVASKFAGKVSYKFSKRLLF